MIPVGWDGLEGLDMDGMVNGHVTAEFYVTRFGIPNPTCSGPSAENDCFPIKLVNMLVGTYGSELTASKVSNPTPMSNPERDIYFCGNRVCSEGDPGATASGWLGPNN